MNYGKMSIVFKKRERERERKREQRRVRKNIRGRLL
jgi:hypothetical protein